MGRDDNMHKVGVIVVALVAVVAVFLMFQGSGSETVVVVEEGSESGEAIVGQAGSSDYAKGVLSENIDDMTTVDDICDYGSGSSSLECGYGSSAEDGHSFAIGYSNDATGKYSSAFGSNTKATNTYSTTLGVSTTASGHSSTAIGRYTTASGASSVSIGSYSEASGEGSIAMGQYSLATHEDSFVIGLDATSNDDDYCVSSADKEFRICASDMVVELDVTNDGDIEEVSFAELVSAVCDLGSGADFCS